MGPRPAAGAAALSGKLLRGQAQQCVGLVPLRGLEPVGPARVGHCDPYAPFSRFFPTVGSKNLTRRFGADFANFSEQPGWNNASF